MATASSTYTWGDPGNLEGPLKDYLGVTDSSEDANLQLWLIAAAQECDDYVKHDWTDDDGNNETHSPLVKLGIFAWVKAFRACYQRGENPGVTSRRTGPLQETYATGSAGGDVALIQARRAAWPFWEASVKEPVLVGKGY